MVDWSDDRIAALSDQDLKNLLVNAERKSVAEVVAQCKAEMEKRDAAKPRKTSKPRTELKEFEHDMSAQLAVVGREMAEKYDLSEETAKANSAGVKGFKAHKLLDAKVRLHRRLIEEAEIRTLHVEAHGRDGSLGRRKVREDR